MAEGPSLSDRFKAAAFRWADRRRARPATPTLLRTLNYAAGLIALGLLVIVAAAVALRSAPLGLELGARLAFLLCLILAARPWVRGIRRIP